MKSLIIIRERLGVSRAQLAVLLGVDRSIVSKAETNQRSLSKTACQTLISLDEVLSLIQPSQHIQVENPSEEENYYNLHEERYEDCIMQSRILQRELEQKEIENEKGQTLLSVLDAIDPVTDKQRICIDGLRRKWKKKLKQCSFHARQYLKDRIRLLRNEAFQIREILESRKLMKQLLTEKI